MTYREDCTLPAELLQQVQEQGLDVLPELIRIVINQAMLAERQQHLHAEPYQRTSEREGYANGFKPKTMRTRVGDITFAIPQVREGEFYPQALEKGLQSERALTLALAEMYVQGVSTRKVKAITEQLCGVSISSSAVSQAASQLDSELAKWRERPLGEYPFLFLDAYYEQVREDGQVRDLAVLVAVAVNLAGKREILGVSVSLSEHEVHWRAFLESLKQRGLGGVQLVTSDDQAGLRAARVAVFGGIPWQRCQFHLQQNAQAYVPHKDMLAEVAADIRMIFEAPDRPTADAYLAKAVAKYKQSASRLSEWMAANIPEGLTVFACPAAMRKMLRTSNGVERLHREVRRRARVVSIFPNPASCLRLVSAILCEISEEWLTGRTYINFGSTHVGRATRP
ncbi:MAG TPA: IS256 family transposase [Anaerolineales bacterium]|nr:IS256 family transposase [Anaerolineales bacterium]